MDKRFTIPFIVLMLINCASAQGFLGRLKQEAIDTAKQAANEAANQLAPAPISKDGAGNFVPGNQDTAYEKQRAEEEARLKAIQAERQAAIEKMDADRKENEAKREAAYKQQMANEQAAAEQRKKQWDEEEARIKKIKSDQEAEQARLNAQWKAENAKREADAAKRVQQQEEDRARLAKERRAREAEAGQTAYHDEQSKKRLASEEGRPQRQEQAEQQGVMLTNERPSQTQQKSVVAQQQAQAVRKDDNTIKPMSTPVKEQSHTSQFISDHMGLLAVLLLVVSPVIIFGGVRLSAGTSLVIFKDAADVTTAFLAVSGGVAAGYLLMNDYPRWGMVCIVSTVLMLCASIAYSFKANVNGAYPGKSVFFALLSVFFKLAVATATICLLIPGIVVGAAMVFQGMSNSDKGRRSGEGGGRGGWDQARERKKEAAKNIAVGGASMAFCLWQVRQIPKMIKK